MTASIYFAALPLRLKTTENITGMWRGSYSYDVSERMPSRPSVPFMLTLDQGWLSRFRGTVVDNATPGMPGTGTITGTLSYPHIEFTKQMPVSYVASPSGRKITLREYLIERGYACERDVPHAPILYSGEFSDADHAAGTWIVRKGLIPLPDGRGCPVAELTGSWTMEKMGWP